MKGMKPIKAKMNFKSKMNFKKGPAVWMGSTYGAGKKVKLK